MRPPLSDRDHYKKLPHRQNRPSLPNMDATGTDRNSQRNGTATALMQTQITQPPTTSMPAPAGCPTTTGRLPPPVRSSLLVACITAAAVAVAGHHHLERAPLVAGEMACALAAARTVGRGLHRRAQTRSWRETGRDLTVAVNLSARQFEHQQMADVVAGVLRVTGLTPEALELELTESVALADPVAITSTRRDIKSLGVSCSIVDFGTGYSGLSYLSRLPIDTLTIDKSFIHQIAPGDDEARIVAAIIALAHGLRMRVIAEGVETVEQLSFLQANGCDEMQGYLVSEPLCVEAFGTLLLRPASTRLDRGPVLTLPDRLFRPAIAVPRARLERTIALTDTLASASRREG